MKVTKQAATPAVEEARRRRRLSRRRVVLAVVCERDGYTLRVSSQAFGARYDSWWFERSHEIVAAVRDVLESPMRFRRIVR